MREERRPRGDKADMRQAEKRHEAGRREARGR